LKEVGLKRVRLVTEAEALVNSLPVLSNGPWPHGSGFAPATSVIKSTLDMGFVGRLVCSRQFGEIGTDHRSRIAQDSIPRIDR
jgi:hypothetical protein